MRATTTITNAPPRPPRRSARLWRAFVRMWKKPHTMTLGQVATAGLVLAIAGVLIVAGFQRVYEHETATTRADTLEREYRTAIDVYDRATADYALCLKTAATRVQTRLDIRDVLFDYANGVVDILPASPLAQQFAQARINFVNAHYPALDLATVQGDCIAPGEIPVDPNPPR